MHKNKLLITFFHLKVPKTLGYMCLLASKSQINQHFVWILTMSGFNLPPLIK